MACSSTTPRWRWIFLINIPIAAATILAAQKWVPETKNPEDVGQFDIPGALLAVVALAGTTYALIEWGNQAAPWAAVVRRGRGHRVRGRRVAAARTR